MLNVYLPSTRITTSQLGFGCSAIMGAGTESARQRLLACAFEHGIRHFDVARAYGVGEAESVLGRFIKANRSQLTITTKYGINPPKRNAAKQIVLNIGRYVKRMVPGFANVSPAINIAASSPALFSAAEARISLETSLRSLGTDYVDLYLLHEPPANAKLDDELLLFLETVKGEGKIRAYGIGGDFEIVKLFLKSQSPFAKVLQFDNDIISRQLSQIDSEQSNAAITFRGLYKAFDLLLMYVAAHPDIAHQWSQILDLNISDTSALSSLMFAWAARDNINGIVLFSTSSPSRVAENVRSVETLIERNDLLDKFEQLVSTEVAAQGIKQRN
jgi:D-threo-aldose 1-dehydrogenase